MVKISEIPLDDKHPNRSTIVINDDSVVLYLFADGFNGLNAQVGHMRLENIFIEDKREQYHLPKSKDDATVINYKLFFKNMIDEYNRHYSYHGDSYIKCDITRLYFLLTQSENTSLQMYIDNPSHLFDVANFCMFLYAGIMREKEGNK